MPAHCVPLDQYARPSDLPSSTAQILDVHPWCTLVPAGCRGGLTEPFGLRELHGHRRSTGGNGAVDRLAARGGPRPD